MHASSGNKGRTNERMARDEQEREQNTAKGLQIRNYCSRQKKRNKAEVETKISESFRMSFSNV